MTRTAQTDPDAITAPQRAGPGLPSTPHTHLSFLACRAGAREHELAAQRGVAERLAALLGCRFAGDADPAAPSASIGYAVPNDTLTSIEDARRWGIRSEADLFGGVVPFPSSPPRPSRIRSSSPMRRRRPDGAREFAERVAQVVLPGCRPSRSTMRARAGRALLRDGPVRLKLASGIGGAGQSVARRRGAARRAARGARRGRVARATASCSSATWAMRAPTASASCASAGLTASYFGTQRTDKNRHGDEVYGGSTLDLVRGGLDAARAAGRRRRGAPRRRAGARPTTRRRFACFAGMFASRCNYDVVQGRDASGRRSPACSSSRGASAARAAPRWRRCEALSRDPRAAVVRASTVEVLRRGPPCRRARRSTSSGVDEHVGPITKYA